PCRKRSSANLSVRPRTLSISHATERLVTSPSCSRPLTILLRSSIVLARREISSAIPSVAATPLPPAGPPSFESAMTCSFPRRACSYAQPAPASLLERDDDGDHAPHASE